MTREAILAYAGVFVVATLLFVALIWSLGFFSTPDPTDPGTVTKRRAMEFEDDQRWVAERYGLTLIGYRYSAYRIEATEVQDANNGRMVCDVTWTRPLEDVPSARRPLLIDRATGRELPRLATGRVAVADRDSAP